MMSGIKEIKRKWYECKMRCERTGDSGMSVFVTELYVVDAMSFTEAESRVTEYACVYGGMGAFEVDAIKKANYTTVVINDAEDANRWYKAKIAFITIDEMSGKERKTKQSFLVQASNMNGASDVIDEFMKGSMSDYEKVTIEETRIIDVIMVGEK